MIGNNRQDQQGTMQQGSAGIMGVGGPQAATGNAVKTPTKRKAGTGFAGLQSYLTNNPNAAAQETQNLNTESANIGQQITQGSQQVQGNIQGQKAVNRNSTYNDVDMSPVKNLEESAGNLQKKGQLLASGDYTGYAMAQGRKPMTAGEGALYSGMMGATMAEQMPQVQGIAKQNVATEALKGLAQTQDTQKAAYNAEVAKYQKDYETWQTEQNRLAQEAIARLQAEEQARQAQAETERQAREAEAARVEAERVAAADVAAKKAKGEGLRGVIRSAGELLPGGKGSTLERVVVNPTKGAAKVVKKVGKLFG